MQRIVIIGSGYIGDCHINAYNAISKDVARVVAIVDANPEAGKKAAAKAGCPTYTTLEEAAAEQQFDVVDICVPTFLHDSFAVKAAQMGKHVLCEKPTTLSLEQFDRMNEACKENGVKFMTGQVARFIPEFVEIARRLRAGQLGALHMFSEKRLSQHPAWTRWHVDPVKSGGGLFDLNIHDIDYIYSLFGMPETVYAAGWKSATGCWNHVVTTMRWPDKQALCETSLQMTGPFPFSVEVRATGDAGTLCYSSTAGDNIKDAEAKVQFRHYPEGGQPDALTVEQYDPFRMEIEGFLQAIETDGAVPVPPEDTRNVLRIVLASRESLETGQVISL